MKVYGIATFSRECFGQGDYGEVTKIVPTGAYYNGPFPPIFKTFDAASEWAEHSGILGNIVIVSMNLVE